MSLNRRRSLDPRWLTHHRSVPAGFMLATITINRVSDPLAAWTPQNQGQVGTLDQLWRGQARIQSNKDWRVRHVDSANDPQMVQFVRIQIPLKAGNPPPSLHTADMIYAEPPDPDSSWEHARDLSRYTYYVRNQLSSSNEWVRNILCAVDLSEEPREVGP